MRPKPPRDTQLALPGSSGQGQLPKALRKDSVVNTKPLPAHGTSARYKGTPDGPRAAAPPAREPPPGTTLSAPSTGSQAVRAASPPAR